MKFMSAAYRKEMQKQLLVATKGTAWRQANGVVFRQQDEWFIAGHWRNISADPADGHRIEIMAKPMAIDPMLWEIMDLQENNKQPLSFRYWGAFICGTPVLKCEILNETAPAKSMPLMLATLDRLVPEVLVLLEKSKFSDLAKNPAGIHDNWRMGETIIHALRLENEPELSLKYAEAHTGAFSNLQTMENLKIAGKRHNELVASAIRDRPKRSLFRSLIDRTFKY